MAELSPGRQLIGWGTEEIGGLPHLSPQTQATTCRAKSKIRNQLQYVANEIAFVQSASLHANRRKARFGHFKFMERLGIGRESLRRMAFGRNHALGTA